MVNTDLVGCVFLFSYKEGLMFLGLICFQFLFSWKSFICLDMIIRIKNAILNKSRSVLVLRTNLIVNIAKILKEEGFIEDFEECGKAYVSNDALLNKYVSLTLKYKGVRQKSYITNLKRVSKPGLRVYVSANNIPKVLGGLGVAVCAVIF